MAEGEETTPCPGCGAVHHGECWREIGGCGVYGCSHVPPTEKRNDLEIPAGHWGKETKACPRCGVQIQAMAVRCRHCGAEMSAGAGQSDQAWKAERAEIGQRATLRSRCIWVFALCAIPPLAPICVLPATFWLWRRWSAIARISGLHRTLAVVGVGLAWLMCLGLVTALFVASHTGD